MVPGAALNRSRLIATGLVLLCVVCTARASVTPAPAPSHDPAMEAALTLQRAFNEVGRGDVDAAQADLDNAIESRGFAGLTKDVRYRALLIAGMIAAEKGQDGKAHDLAVRATGFHQADGVAWMIRFASADAIGDYRDAGHSLAVLAARWPGKLEDLVPGAVFQLHYQLKLAHAADVDMAMLDALFDADWQVGGVEPSGLWRDLALAHLERHQVARATRAALRITSARVAVSVLVDKRFDPVTHKHRDAFNVKRLVGAEIEAATARMKAHPDRLQPVTDLQELLLETGQYQRVLAVSDAAVAAAEKGDGRKTWTDFDDRYIWVLDYRSRASKRMGRWDDAVRIESLAARLPENGGINVSQAINLGALYAGLGQPDQAANAIVQLGDLAPVGRMQREYVKLRIAIEKHDQAGIDAAMAYLRKHRVADMQTWQDALLLRGRLDEAAALLIERLENPAWRSEALVEMQHYIPVTEPPMDKVIGDNWNAITARPDVLAAMRSVGRIESFPIAPGLR